MRCLRICWGEKVGDGRARTRCGHGFVAAVATVACWYTMAGAQVSGDFSQPWWPDTMVAADSARNVNAKPQARIQPRLQLVKREFDHRKQIYLAAGMMAFVALFMTSSQMWNPE